MLEARHTLTVDGSADLGRRVVGVGIVLQATDRPHRRGPVVSTVSEAFSGVALGQAEEVAILRALQVAALAKATVVTIRSDYNCLRRHLKEAHRSGLVPESPLRRAILDLARYFVSVTFAYVPRRKNIDAHRLARHAASQLAPLPLAALLANQDG